MYTDDQRKQICDEFYDLICEGKYDGLYGCRECPHDGHAMCSQPSGELSDECITYMFNAILSEKGDENEMSTRGGTHLCGSLYNPDDRCEYLIYVTHANTMYGNKKLKQYYAYCTVDGHCRSLGCAASYTGNSPTWCPKRKEAACGTATPTSGK